MKLFFILFLLTLLSACNSATLPTRAPDNFSHYENTKYSKSVSANGVVYRIKQVSLKQGDINFWKTALKTRMVDDSGYIFVGEKTFTNNEQEAYYIELKSPMGPEDYTYIIAIYPQPYGLMLIESAGEIKVFEEHREDILRSITRWESGGI